MQRAGLGRSYLERNFIICYADNYKSLDGANNYSNCQTVFRNFHKIEEGTYVDSSPGSRTGYEHGDDDWLNIMGFGDRIFNYIQSFEKLVLSKLGIG